MRQRCVTVALLVAAAAASAGALGATPAAAAGISPAAADCLKHGQLTKDYSVPELQHALATLPASVSEYSNCSAVLTQALDSKIGKVHGGKGSGGGSFLPTWLLVVLIVLVLGGAALVGVAFRRRQGPD